MTLWSGSVCVHCETAINDKCNNFFIRKTITCYFFVNVLMTCFFLYRMHSKVVLGNDYTVFMSVWREWLCCYVFTTTQQNKTLWTAKLYYYVSTNIGNNVFKCTYSPSSRWIVTVIQQQLVCTDGVLLSCAWRSHKHTQKITEPSYNINI